MVAQSTSGGPNPSKSLMRMLSSVRYWQQAFASIARPDNGVEAAALLAFSPPSTAFSAQPSTNRENRSRLTERFCNRRSARCAPRLQDHPAGTSPVESGLFQVCERQSRIFIFRV